MPVYITDGDPVLYFMPLHNNEGEYFDPRTLDAAAWAINAGSPGASEPLDDWLAARRWALLARGVWHNDDGDRYEDVLALCAAHDYSLSERDIVAQAQHLARRLDQEAVAMWLPETPADTLDECHDHLALPMYLGRKEDLRPGAKAWTEFINGRVLFAAEDYAEYPGRVPPEPAGTLVVVNADD